MRALVLEHLAGVREVVGFEEQHRPFVGAHHKTGRVFDIDAVAG